MKLLLNQIEFRSINQSVIFLSFHLRVLENFSSDKENLAEFIFGDPSGWNEKEGSGLFPQSSLLSQLLRLWLVSPNPDL